ncbi:Putative ribonuclease H protein At1g65750 [Linum perenne]
MDYNVSREVSEILGIAATRDLGRYFGVPILHGRITRSTYEYILSRMDNKLFGWKANNLSLAGRVTVASFVLNAIPSYVMQTSFLPSYIFMGSRRLGTLFLVQLRELARFIILTRRQSANRKFWVDWVSRMLMI